MSHTTHKDYYLKYYYESELLEQFQQLLTEIIDSHFDCTYEFYRNISNSKHS